jgi:hypothetical protein
LTTKLTRAGCAGEDDRNDQRRERDPGERWIPELRKTGGQKDARKKR